MRPRYQLHTRVREADQVLVPRSNQLSIRTKERRGSTAACHAWMHMATAAVGPPLSPLAVYGRDGYCYLVTTGTASS